ncbi:MAG: SRPBCC family protein [Saprospiraceae bacterium]|nr:SRPBCC family protein [Saprospiraceae bacterium]
MKALKILLYIVLALAIAVVTFGLFARKDYHIERSIEIDAPATLVYNHVRFFKNFDSWSPWAELDRGMETTISGTDGEVGATYTWSGNNDVGKGKQVIRSLSPQRMETDVVFTEPWENTAPTFMTFEAAGKKTKVTWGMDMTIPFPWNGFAMFTNMDLALGRDYERGLARLKKATEAIAHKKYRGYEVAVEELPILYYVGTRKNIAIPKIPAEYASGFSAVMTALNKAGVAPAGMPSGLYWAHNDSTQMVDMAAAVPIATEQPIGRFSVFPMGGKALIIDYLGSYDTIGRAHYAMDAYMAEHNLTQRAPVVEQYITDPEQEPDTSKWLTRLVYFVE